MPSPPPARRPAAPRRSTRQPARPRARTGRGERPAAASRSRTRAARAPVGPATTNGTGEISTSARSKPRARRSISAPAARSSSSGVSAITSAFGGSVRARDDVEVLPCVVEDDLRVEQRVDDPVELRHAGRGQQPVEHAAEADQADAVLVLEVVLDERGRGAHGAVERGLVLTARLRERVEEEDDVGVPLGMKLVHPQLAAPRARAPVDPPDAVSGHELRRSANSIPSPFSRATRFPVKTCVSSGRRSSLITSGRG